MEIHAKKQHLARCSSLVTKSPVFYGWIIMLSATVGMIFTSPGQTDSVSVFVEHFIGDLGLSRSLVSTLYTVGTLAGSLALPVVGRQIDRRGPRRMVGVITVLFGLACIYMGVVQNAFMLGLGFVSIRMLGQGSLSLVCRNVINQWWVRRRGMVMGISGFLLALFGMGGSPNLINFLIPLYGWRQTYMLLGLMIMAVMLPVGLGLFRNRPEEYGLPPDGRSPEPVADAPAAEPLEENWTLAEAVRTRAFWIPAAGLASISMLTTGLFFHMVGILGDGGLTPAQAASIYLPIALTMAFTTLASGLLLLRIPAQVLLAASLLLQALALMLAAQFVKSMELALLYGIVLGISIGLSSMVSSVIWANTFGRDHLGSITGVAVTISVVGTALGPMPMGIARDLLSNYKAVLTASATVPLLLAVASLSVKPPRGQK